MNLLVMGAQVNTNQVNRFASEWGFRLIRIRLMDLLVNGDSGKWIY